MLKVLKSTCRKLWCLSTCKKSTSSLTLFWDIVKTLQTCFFWELWECLTIPIKIIASVCSKLSCLPVCKKSTSSLTSFLRCCKEIANLLFRVIWTCLATHTWNDSIWGNTFRLYGIGGEISTAKLAFILEYFQEKLFK